MRVGYLLNATLQPDEDSISRHHQRCGQFILATNVLDVACLSADGALKEYKVQQATEQGLMPPK